MSIENMPIDAWNSLPLNRKKKRGKPENKVKKACMDLLARLRIPRNRQQSGMVKVINPKTRETYWLHLAEEGSGDIVGCLPPDGRYFEIETKAPGKHLEKEQRARKAIIEAAGGLYIEAHDIDEMMAGLGKK